MKKILLLTICLFITGCGSANTISRDKTPPEELCKKAGGNWVLFNAGCGDSCSVQKDCTMALEYNCECGANKCWDGKVCKQN